MIFKKIQDHFGGDPEINGNQYNNCLLLLFYFFMNLQ